jgi:hypothetical protein
LAAKSVHGPEKTSGECAPACDQPAETDQAASDGLLTALCSYYCPFGFDFLISVSEERTRDHGMWALSRSRLPQVDPIRHYSKFLTEFD